MKQDSYEKAALGKLKGPSQHAVWFKSCILRETDICTQIWDLHVVVKWRGKKTQQTLYLREQLDRTVHGRRNQRHLLQHLGEPCHASTQAKPCLVL